jgi:hypothetical protein
LYLILQVRELSAGSERPHSDPSAATESPLRDRSAYFYLPHSCSSNEASSPHRESLAVFNKAGGPSIPSICHFRWREHLSYRMYSTHTDCTLHLIWSVHVTSSLTHIRHDTLLITLLHFFEKNFTRESVRPYLLITFC